MSAPAVAGEFRSFRERFDRPLFIVSTPRSGSTLLFETVAKSPDLYSIWGESHSLIETIPSLSPATRGWASNRLTSSDATADVPERVARNFYESLRNRERQIPSGRVRMLEKTPKNALRVSFFHSIWPDAQFIYLYRDVRPTLASMMEAWVSGAFRTYPQLPGWTGFPWSLLLVPNWQKLIGQPLPAVVAHQWAVATQTLLDDLEALPAGCVRVIDYSEFVDCPHEHAVRLVRSLDLRWDQQLASTLPLSQVTVSPPRKDKWRRLEREIEAVFPIVAQADERARAFLHERLERT